ncbi:hypothetical protein Hypma_013358 [Hypsizygus marmoreus]|uniref:Uncharacterized protein n=1 Tax=Hypsizygus marmoreus TaxID=39966 RepID=A0A369JEC6_HYPMA|nr:hypothetical protein Hypma_013358 [Hypsizygus marmoreus]
MVIYASERITNINKFQSLTLCCSDMNFTAYITNYTDPECGDLHFASNDKGTDCPLTKVDMLKEKFHIQVLNAIMPLCLGALIGGKGSERSTLTILACSSILTRIFFLGDGIQLKQFPILRSKHVANRCGTIINPKISASDTSGCTSGIDHLRSQYYYNALLAKASKSEVPLKSPSSRSDAFTQSATMCSLSIDPMDSRSTCQAKSIKEREEIGTFK